MIIRNNKQQQKTYTILLITFISIGCKNDRIILISMNREIELAESRINSLRKCACQKSFISVNEWCESDTCWETRFFPFLSFSTPNVINVWRKEGSQTILPSFCCEINVLITNRIEMNPFSWLKFIT